MPVQHSDAVMHGLGAEIEFLSDLLLAQTSKQQRQRFAQSFR